MGFLGLFLLHLFDPDAFDKELTALTQGISRTRNQITALARKRKSLCFNLVTSLLVAYLAWVAYRYRVAVSSLGPLAGGRSRWAVFFAGQDTHDLVAAGLYPVAIALVVYIVDSLFSVLISSKEKSLKGLLRRHKTKIDELKRVTNFNTTNQLLQKYGKQETAPAPAKEKQAADLRQRKPQPPLASKSQPQRTNVLPPTVNRPAPAVPPPQPKPKPLANQGPVQKTFQDRILDYIIGSEHNESVESRYALICANCYTHNGLAPPGCTDPNKVTYICRQCGYINGGIEEAAHLREKVALAQREHLTSPELEHVPEKEEVSAPTKDSQKESSGIVAEEAAPVLAVKAAEKVGEPEDVAKLE